MRSPIVLCCRVCFVFRKPGVSRNQWLASESECISIGMSIPAMSLLIAYEDSPKVRGSNPAAGKPCMDVPLNGNEVVDVF